MDMGGSGMMTLGLAFISGKYKIEFEFLYLATFMIDLGLVDALIALCKR